MQCDTGRARWKRQHLPEIPKLAADALPTKPERQRQKCRFVLCKHAIVSEFREELRTFAQAISDATAYVPAAFSCGVTAIDDVGVNWGAITDERPRIANDARYNSRACQVHRASKYAVPS